MPNKKPQKMRVQNIVEEFPVSRATIWNYAKQGKLHPIKVSAGVTVFDREEVEAFFNGAKSAEVAL